MSDWLEIGQKAPDFTLHDDQGNKVKLADFLGKTVVLYFYPKDDTPGCTAQACDIRDAKTELSKAKVVVLGVSGDDVASHASFRDKYQLNFPLLADVGNTVAIAYGAYREKNMYGKKSMGIQRSTYIIDENGNIARVFKRVLAKQHLAQVLKALEALKN